MIAYTEEEELNFIQPKKVSGEMIPMSVIEDIKAEVRKAQEEIYDTPKDVYEPDYWMREGMDYVLEIIDKHIRGKEQE